MIAALLATGTPSKTADSTQFYFWTAVLLVGAVALAAAVLVFVGRWVRRASGRVSAGDELTNFRLLYERGELGREEYERIRAQLAPRLRKELDLPAPRKKDVSSPVGPNGEPDTRTQAKDGPPGDPPPFGPESA